MNLRYLIYFEGYLVILSKFIRGIELKWEYVFVKDESFNFIYDVSVGFVFGLSDIMCEVGL